MFDGLNLGVILLLAGLALFGLIWFLSRYFAQMQPKLQSAIRTPDTDVPNHTDAVIMIGPGGRVEYVNAHAREWFGLTETETPNLERLARRTRPSDDFLYLCRAEGNIRFSIGGRLVEGVSYQVPGEPPMMLLSLRQPELASGIVQADEVSGSVLRIVTDFSETIAANLKLDATLLAVLKSVDHLIPADMLEIKVWDAGHERLIPYRFGSNEGRRSLDESSESLFGAYSTYLTETKEALFVPDTQKFSEVRFLDDRQQFPIRSYLGVPLLAGGELIGVLEAGQISAEAYNKKDLDLIQLIAIPAAIAIRNARLYENEQKRSAELSSLANLAQAAGSLQDPDAFYSRLIENIQPLFDVKILGFLLYDENRRILAGQNPFVGIPAHVIDVYRTKIGDGSPAEVIIQSRKMILSDEATDDEQWSALGLDNIAQAASLHESALVPLLSGERMLGYLQISNHNRGKVAFSDDELRLMEVVANQVAAIIDNAALVMQTRQRAQRAEALRRIASVASSAATIDETLRFSLRELLQLLRADSAVVFLLDEEQGQLNAHLESIIGVSAESIEKFSTLYTDDPQYRYTVTGSQRAFITGRLSADRRIIEFYRPMVDVSEMESALVVPLVIRERSVGEIMIASREVDFFDDYDLQVTLTVAGQLATAIEEFSVTEQTDESLRARVEQLTSLARVTRELNVSQDLAYLLRIVYEEGLRLSKADCGTITLFEFDDDAQSPRTAMVLGCARGEDLTEIERSVVKSGEAVLVQDVNDDGQHASHAGVRSALVAPIAHRGKTVGLFHLHSARPDHFDKNILSIVQTLAVQAAIAFGNAYRFREQSHQGELLRRRANTLSSFLDTTSQFDIDQSLETALEKLARGIRAATPFDTVLMSVYEPETGLLRRVTGVGIPETTLQELKDRKQPLVSIQQLLKDEFKIGRAHYIPADQMPIVPADVHMVTLDEKENADGQDSWAANDFLLFLLQDKDGNPLGLISLDQPRDGRRPDLAAIETIEVFAAQTALVISAQTKVGVLQEQVTALTTGIERQERLLRVSQNDLPILLHKDLAQMITVQNLDQRARRIRAGLQITESVSRQLDSASALQALGREILTHLGMTTALVAEETAEGPRLIHVMGNVPRATNPEALFGQRNPLRSCLQSGKARLTMNLDDDDEWRDTALLTALHAKSFFSLPIKVEGKVVAAILAVSQEAMPNLSEEDQQVYFQIARQSSVILQNIELLTSARRRLQEVRLLLDFSSRLSGLGPDSIVEALLESALRVIPAAHAGILLLWDERRELLVPKIAQHYADSESMLGIVYKSGEALPGKTFADRAARHVDEVDFARDYTLSAAHLLRYRQATGGRLPISSLLIPVQTGDRCLGVLVLDNFNKTGAFHAEDETLLLSLAQQVALSLENLRLVDATAERAGQLQALNDVAATMTASLQSGELIDSLLEQFSAVTPFDTATLWLHEGELLRVAAARGFPDSEDRLDLTVAVADSALFNEMIQTGEGVAIPDVRQDARFPSLVEAERLSWMGIPLISKGDVVGAIALEKAEANFYTETHLQIATTFASQAAVALENARLYADSLGRAAELDERSQRLALLNRFSAELGGSLKADQALWMTANELLRALNASQVSVVTLERGQVILKDVLPDAKRAAQGDLPQPLPETPLFGRLRESLGMFTTDDVRSESELIALADFLSGTTALMVLPLFSNEILHALLFIHKEQKFHFSPNEIELARTIGNQASIALENARLYQSTLSTAERMQILNEVSSEISASLEPDKIYAAVHTAAQRLMPTESFVIALIDEERQVIDGVYLVDHGERAPRADLPLGKGISGKVIDSGQPVLLHDMQSVEKIVGAGGGRFGTPQSIVAVPMRSGDKIIGMIAAQSDQPNVYTENDQQILSTLANQSIAAIRNGRLFNETQRLAEELEQRVIDRTAALQAEKKNTETLLDILMEVSASLDLDLALKRTLALLNDTIGAEQGTIMLLDPEDNMLHYRAGYGYRTDTKDDKDGFALRVGEGLAGWVVQNRDSILINDLDKDARWVAITDDEERHRSAVAAPLMVGEDVIGVLLVFNREAYFFNPEQLNLIKAIAGQVAVAINNASLYKMIREQAERLGSMLRKEQEDASRSQAILEAVADGVLVTDSENKISFMNASAAQILALNAEETLDQSLDDFGGLFGKTANIWRQTIREWSEDPAGYETGATYAEQLELEDGRVVLVHLAPVMLESYFLGTVSIFRDITHEVEVDRLKSEFVATVSHELRTPMTSIRGYVDILLMGAAGALTENQTHFLDIIRSNTSRLSVLVDDLLDVSRIEAGRITLTPEELDIQQIAQDVIEGVLRRSNDEARPMKITLKAMPKLPSVLGDAQRVRQIVNNLVENAYHYTPDNGKIVVNLRVVNGNEEVQIDVKDNGVGIAPKDQEQVFDRFYRGEDPLVLATPGTGLGLPIVKQLVEMHNGRIWVESTGKAGEGSKFSFTLPIYQSSE